MATVRTRVWKGFPPRKLSFEQAEKVRSLPWERGSLRRLAKEYDVTPTVIWNIRHGYSYKLPLPQQTYLARVTDRGERYYLGSFRTPEAAQNAIDNFERSNKWPRGSIEKAKHRFRARLSLGVYDTRWAAERACFKAIEKLSENA